ncbi:acyl carrier protein [Streptomyces sp. GMR22]|uniref:acyl carrier protein n=1 Tax=Streptomyces sp. GMR22 TaxID=2759524 RepID=UPI0015FB8821|nr:acyl carrier protein [Streptomyces sp. GMR22]MBA6439084.1 acyl carrier protein [Streptomyces sp. GMR22]
MDIEAAIRQILVDDLFAEADADRIGPDDSLRDTVGLDSLGFMELRVQCENRFGVSISDDDYSPENFASVRRLAQLVRSLQEARTGASGQLVDGGH